MYRLICIALLTALLAATLGCGGGHSPIAAGGRDGALRREGPEFPGWSWTEETEYATLVDTAPVSPEVAALFGPRRQPSVSELPALPKLDSLPRSASLTVQHERLGFETYRRSGNASPSGESLVLSADEGETSWAIYEFDGLSGINELQLLQVEASNVNFDAENDNPGYWVGWADFSRDSWEIKSLTQHVIYQRTVGATAKYLSAGGSFYCFILVADGQSVTIDHVKLDVDAGNWTEIAVDTGEDRGWTPAMVFTVTGNPAVAYADLATGKPRWAIGNRSADLTILSNWSYSSMEIHPNGVAKWMDAVIDPEYQYPRVSMVFEGATGGSWNSTIGFALIAEPFGTPVWGTYVVGDIDGAEYTSLDRRQLSGYYGVANMARNDNRTDQTANDLQYRLFQLEDPNSGGEIPVTLKRGFLAIFSSELPDPFAFKNPHLRYQPDLGAASIAVHGGYLLYENTADEWALPYATADSGDFGSLAFNPVSDYFGQTYEVTDGATSELRFIEYSLSTPGTPQVVDSSTSAGGQRVGTVSQLAYTPDGDPGIAYTVFDGTYTRVMYASYNGAAWESEPVSTDYMDNVGDATVQVDLAYDDSGTPAVCYSYIDGSNSELRVALRGL